MATYEVKGVINPNSQKLVLDAGGHEVIIDNPVDGYTAEGPPPGYILAASLAGCKAVVAAGYFKGRDKKVKIDVTVKMDVEKEGKKNKGNFVVDLYFAGQVDEEEIKKVEKILDDRCLVEHIIMGDDNTLTTNYHI